VRTLHFIPFIALGLIGCGGSTAVGTSKQLDDAHVPSASSNGSGGASGVAVTVTHSRIPGADASLVDAAGIPDASATDAMSCGSPSVTDVGGNHVSGLPADSCGSPDAPECTTGKVSFSCPTVVGPGDSGTIHPGDTIRINFVATSDGQLYYPCWGLVADRGVIGSTDITYAIPMTGWELSAKIPSSFPPGTTAHFVLHVVSDSALNTSSCAGNRGRLDFDVRID